MIVFNVPVSDKADSLHTTLLKGLRARIDLCDEKRDSFDRRVDNNEKRVSLYRVKHSKDDKKKAAKNKGESEYAEVVVPYSYSLMVSAHTYMVNVFLQRDPIFSVSGVQDEGKMKELAMETLLRYQIRAGGASQNLLVWLLDPCRYGSGILGSYWCENEKIVTSIEERPVTENGVEIAGRTEKYFKRQKVKGFVGNKVFNVYPKDFIFDPRLPLHAVQDMEFVGRKTTISVTEALAKEANGEYFNVEHVIKKLKTKDKDRDRGGDVDKVLNELTGDASVDKTNVILDNPVTGKTGQLELEELSVTLIPTQWGIAESGNMPEKWHFTIANNDTIICAYPQGTLHQEHGYHVLEMELDGYRQDSRSLMEMSEPMNDVLSWLFNSHMWNRRSAMNNQFVFDPMRIEERDMRSTKAGKMIRLKATAYGSDVRTAVTQLPVNDVTQGNIQDAMIVEKMMQRQIGANEDVAGSSSTSSRRSATEFQATTGFSMGRLARDALHFGVTGWQSLGSHLISNTQQFYTMEEKLKLGGYTGVDAEAIDVSPEAIAGKFEVVPVDGTMPMNRLQEANFWKEALMGLHQMPEIQQMYRIEDIFAHMARLSGLTNISKFRVEPDERVQRMMEMGLLEHVRNPEGTTGAPGVAGGAGEEAGGVGDAFGALSVPSLPGSVATPKPQ